MTDLSELRLFATKPHQCSYLEDKQATTLFVDPKAPMDYALFSQLSEFGFRRSGHHVYRPKCVGCNACIPIRIPVVGFRPSRSQKRCLKANRDIQTQLVSSIDTDEHYELYANYIERRHADGDMFPPSREQFREFLTSEWGITHFIEYRVKDTLIAVSVADKLQNGISAIYAYFEPCQPKRSLGVFNILFQIQWAKEIGLPFVYLGYWIKKCQKMSYKVEYRPFQVLIDNHWMTINDYAPPEPLQTPKGSKTGKTRPEG